MTVLRLWGTLAVMVLASLGLPSTSAAQLTTATIAGTIKDSAGLFIPGATVTLISEARGTRSTPAITNASGDFVFPNVAPDTYTIEVVMEGFKTLQQTGVAASPGDRVSLPAFTLDVGGQSETVNVRADATLIQSQSGERSFAVETEAVQNLPIASRNFTSLAVIAPGVTVTTNVGGTTISTLGGGGGNILMDGVGISDSFSNALTFVPNVEAIGEVKILTSGYQAEFGRNAGAQITAVTKSGTNRFRGSVYDVQRDSDWNANSYINKQNQVPLPTLKEKDWGFTVGGPVGHPGRPNKLFFFYADEFRPRTAGGAVNRFRLPTELERRGDFSQSRDATGALFPYIWDSQAGPVTNCATTPTGVHTSCFQDGGVLGRIPQDRLYPIGLNVLKVYPLPNDSAGYAANNSYNYVNVAPTVESRTSQQTARIDYVISPALKLTWKLTDQNSTKRPNQADQTFPQGSALLNGFNDAVQTKPHQFQTTAALNYTIGSKTFLEVTYGRFQNYVGTPTITDASNKNNVGLDAFPMLFPDATLVNPAYSAYQRLQDENPPWWDGTRSQILPNFAWGTRIQPAGTTLGPPAARDYGCCLNQSRTDDVNASVTHVTGGHTLKAGFYYQNGYKTQTASVGATTPYNGAISFANDTTNPLDSQFGFANAALGIFASYGQQSKYLEGTFGYNQYEAYIQDNWKVTNKLTLDYGMRFVHQPAFAEQQGIASNFVPEDWSLGNAPVLYQPVCAPGVSPCNRRAQNPVTGQILGAGSASLVGSLVPGTGSATNGIYLPGTGPVPETGYRFSPFGAMPRIGVAYDPTATQKVVIRGGGGLFYDRPSGNALTLTTTNPPYSTSAIVFNSTLQGLDPASAASAPPTLTVYQVDLPLPATWQWNGGAQFALPWASVLDVSYVGRHAYNQLQTVDINAVDYGTGYAPAYQDPTSTSTVPGGAALTANFLRSYLGYGAINRQMPTGWNTFHSIQSSVIRRFRNGLSFGVNYIYTITNTQNAPPRLQHDPVTREFSIRADQAEADELLGDAGRRPHLFKANFVWDLPNLHASGGAMQVVGYVVNDWQLSGVFTGGSGTPYTPGFTYASNGNPVNLTGSSTNNARIALVSGVDPGSGCSSDPMRQFNTAAFAGPVANSVGLESGANFLLGCPEKTLDLAVARNLPLGGNRQIQLRVDIFNALNTVIFTGRNATATFASPATNTAVTNLPFDATGAPIAARGVGRSAGFGVVNASNTGRALQLQLKFLF